MRYQYFIPLLLRLRDHFGKMSRKIVRARGKGQSQENIDFWTQQGSFMHEFTVTVTAHASQTKSKHGRRKWA